MTHDGAIVEGSDMHYADDISAFNRLYEHANLAESHGVQETSDQFQQFASIMPDQYNSVFPNSQYEQFGKYIENMQHQLMPAQGGYMGPSSYWRKDEDEALRLLASGNNLSWTEISLHFPYRTETDCYQRWQKIQNAVAVRANGNKLRTAQDPWTPDEDQMLYELVTQYGPSRWTEVASLINESLGTRRLAKQCRERWISHVDPSVRRGDWTEEEDIVIVTKQQEWGNRWADIARLLVDYGYSGRTTHAVKNRFHQLLRLQHQGKPRTAASNSVPSETEAMMDQRRNLAGVKVSPTMQAAIAPYQHHGMRGMPSMPYQHQQYIQPTYTPSLPRSTCDMGVVPPLMSAATLLEQTLPEDYMKRRQSPSLPHAEYSPKSYGSCSRMANMDGFSHNEYNQPLKNQKLEDGSKRPSPICTSDDVVCAMDFDGVGSDLAARPAGMIDPQTAFEPKPTVSSCSTVGTALELQQQEPQNADLWYPTGCFAGNTPTNQPLGPPEALNYWDEPLNKQPTLPEAIAVNGMHAAVDFSSCPLNLSGEVPAASF